MAVVADRVGVHQRTALATAVPVFAVGMVVCALAGSSYGLVASGVPLAAAVAPVAMLPAAVVDLQSFRLPDRLIIAGALIVAVVAGVELLLGSRMDGASWGSVAIGAACLAGPLLAINVIAPAAMGFGDVKLAIVLGVALGFAEPLLSMVALTLACFVGVAAGVIARQHVIPFGPALIVGTAGALAFGGEVVG